MRWYETISEGIFVRLTDKSVANLYDDLAFGAYPSRELGDRLTPWAQYAKYGST